MVKGVSMSEGLAHLKTKEILLRTKKIALPLFDENKRFVFKFDEIVFEEKIGTYKADCVAIKGNEKLIIEIVDKGKVSDKKRQYYCDNKINSMEILYHLPKNLKEGTDYIDDFLDNKLEDYIHTLRDYDDVKYEDEVPYDEWYYGNVGGENVYPIMDKRWIVNNKYKIYNKPRLKPKSERAVKDGWRWTGASWTPDLRTKAGKEIVKQQEEHLAEMKKKWGIATGWNKGYKL